MPVDHVASMVSLAKAELMSLDRSQVYARVQTATYALLLDTLVEIGDRKTVNGHDVDAAAKRTVMGAIEDLRDQSERMAEDQRKGGQAWLNP